VADKNYEQKDNTSSSFSNKYKTQDENDKRPSFTGTALVGGQQYRTSTWEYVFVDGDGNEGIRQFTAFETEEEFQAKREAAQAAKSQKDSAGKSKRR
jgi:hypothetical protein